MKNDREKWTRVRIRFVGGLFALCLAAAIISAGCTKFGSHADLLAPESARQVQKVMIWPFTVIPVDEKLLKNEEFREWLVSDEGSLYTAGSGDLDRVPVRHLQIEGLARRASICRPQIPRRPEGGASET